MQRLSQEELSKIVDALNTLAKYGLLYAGFRRRQRKVAEVRLTSHIVLKYEDGDLHYINPAPGKTRRLYVYFPPKQ
jgi:hypothetical protein